MLKLVSWNVNGLRSVLKKGFFDSLRQLDPDIMCLQESRVDSQSLPDEFNSSKDFLFLLNPAEKKGYSGTAIITKHKPLNVLYGMQNKKYNEEGRVLTLEFQAFFLINVYTPNSQRDLARLQFRQEWDSNFLAYINTLKQIKPVIFCGDLNVAHEEIDLARPNDNHHNAGFTDGERKGFTNFMKAGYIDTFRNFEKEGGHYSWWSYMNNARAKNIGWRIDYFCVSDNLIRRVQNASIYSRIFGSDHCPIGIEIDI